MNLSISNLTCEYRVNPLGIDVTVPRLSWQMSTQRNGAKQTAYQVVAASSAENITRADIWDSGKVTDDQSLHVPYAGAKLSSRQRVFWQVTVWDELGEAHTSAVAWFEIGLLKKADWKAQWIGAGLVGGARSGIPAPYVRKAFVLPKGFQQARLYITALGLHECTLNGQRVSDDVFAPGWTDYAKRIQYQTYDVTDKLHDGENVLGAILGDGWAAGHVGWSHRQTYTDRPKLLAQLEITLNDGRVLRISSDRTWLTQFGAVVANDMLMGEAYDARLEMAGWDKPKFDDKRWQKVEVFAAVPAQLVANNGPTVKRIEERLPVAEPIVKKTFNRTSTIFDLGQNMVGRVRLKGNAPAGTTVTLRFAEVLNADGSMYVANLRSARATDYYTFSGSGVETWEPLFTFHGFRYVELSDYPNPIEPDTITGVVLHSEMNPTGEFECSNPLINQLQKNIVWGQKGNFVDVPTDCPQRDERLGWTGDAQVFARTAAFNFNIAPFMGKWLTDVSDAQTEAGIVPPVVPQAFAAMPDGGPAWSDAAIIVPHTLYQCYGDERVLERNYATMQKFMQWMLDTSPSYIRCAKDYAGWHGFGDWLSMNANTPLDLIGTAFLAHDCNLMAQIATVLGRRNDAVKYRQLFIEVKAVFANCFLVGGNDGYAANHRDDPARGNLAMMEYEKVESRVFNTKVFQPTQTAYALALQFELLPAKLRPIAAAEMAADVRLRDTHLSAGFAGSSYVPHVLSENGQTETAFALLNQTSWPSWLYAVTQGATTIWERWDGWTPERGFQSEGMNSFNHYAYGAIGAWLYNTVAGIELDPKQPGYKHSVLRPHLGGGLTHASGKLHTAYGMLSSHWQVTPEQFRWRVVVPPNTTASAHVPAGLGTAATLNGSAMQGSVHELDSGEWVIEIARS